MPPVSFATALREQRQAYAGLVNEACDMVAGEYRRLLGQRIRPGEGCLPAVERLEGALETAAAEAYKLDGVSLVSARQITRVLYRKIESAKRRMHELKRRGDQCGSQRAFGEWCSARRDVKRQLRGRANADAARHRARSCAGCGRRSPSWRGMC